MSQTTFGPFHPERSCPPQFLSIEIVCLVDEAGSRRGQGPIFFLGRKNGGTRQRREPGEIKKQKPRQIAEATKYMTMLSLAYLKGKAEHKLAKSRATKQDIAAQEKAGEKKSWKIIISKKQWLNDFGELSFSAKVVRLTMELYADENGECFTAIRTLAKVLHCGNNTIVRAIKELIEKKNVRIIGKHGRANLYLLERFKNY